jgi:hypothetical protein
MTGSRRPFRYAADPLCLASMACYALGRWYLKPHHVGGWFVHDYLNDILCLPLFLPISLGAQRLLRLRRHDAPPRLWEVLQHGIIFSVLFEVILPRYPHLFRTTADPWDAVAYFAGGLIAWLAWFRLARRAGRRSTVGQRSRASSFTGLPVHPSAPSFTGTPTRRMSPRASNGARTFTSLSK